MDVWKKSTNLVSALKSEQDKGNTPKHLYNERLRVYFRKCCNHTIVIIDFNFFFNLDNETKT
ncbi:hypothetical protein Bca4012_075907 [Brassica carinata]